MVGDLAHQTWGAKFSEEALRLLVAYITELEKFDQENNQEEFDRAAFLKGKNIDIGEELATSRALDSVDPAKGIPQAFVVSFITNEDVQ